MDQKPEVTVILGPTASGKTALGISLSKKNAGAVISADSRQIYSGMNIGTAKPEEAWADTIHAASEPDIVEGVPHFLLNATSPDNSMTLPQWQGNAKNVLEDLITKKQHPILVGGTMLYIDSIVKNFSIPTIDPDPELRAELEQKTPETLYTRLLEQDLAAKQFIEPHNKQRIIRALEVIHTSGKPFSELRQSHTSLYTFKLIGLFPGWEIMEQRISDRAKEMFKEGLLEEAKKLQEQYSKDLPLLQTMNYKQAAKVLDGTATLEETIKETIQVNMRYAHRQMSWWKNREEITWFKNAKEAENSL